MPHYCRVAMRVTNCKKNSVNGIKVIAACSHVIAPFHTKRLRTSCLYRREAQLSAVCSIKWGGFPVMFLSPHPAPLQGPLMPPPSSLMLDRADAVWNEMSGWPRYDRENRQQRGPLPSRDGSNYWQYYLQLWAAWAAALFPHFASESWGPPGFPFCCSTVTFFNLLHSCSRTNTMQILRDILYMLRLKYSTQENATSHSPPTSIINVCCHAESDFEACKLDEQNFC